MSWMIPLKLRPSSELGRALEDEDVEEEEAAARPVFVCLLDRAEGGRPPR